MSLRTSKCFCGKKYQGSMELLAHWSAKHSGKLLGHPMGTMTNGVELYYYTLNPEYLNTWEDQSND